MSADNGIYILTTANTEFRVAECSAIENLYDYEDDPDYRQDYLQMNFGSSEVYYSIDDAYKKAKELYNDIITNGGYLEYGINEVVMEIEFPK